MNIYDNFFKVKINGELENILDESYVFFDETHVKAAIKSLNKNSSTRERTTPVLKQNGVEHFTKSLTILLQNCFVLGYFWNKITEYTLSLTKQIITYTTHTDLFSFQIS